MIHLLYFTHGCVDPSIKTHYEATRVLCTPGWCFLLLKYWHFTTFSSSIFLFHKDFLGQRTGRIVYRHACWYSGLDWNFAYELCNKPRCYIIMNRLEKLDSNLWWVVKYKICRQIPRLKPDNIDKSSFKWPRNEIS